MNKPQSNKERLRLKEKEVNDLKWIYDKAAMEYQQMRLKVLKESNFAAMLSTTGKHVVVVDGRWWLCDNTIQGCLERRLNADEIDAVKSAIEEGLLG